MVSILERILKAQIAYRLSTQDLLCRIVTLSTDLISLGTKISRKLKANNHFMILSYNYHIVKLFHILFSISLLSIAISKRIKSILTSASKFHVLSFFFF